MDGDSAACILHAVERISGQGAALRLRELSQDWRRWGQEWLSSAHSAQLALPPHLSDAQQRQRAASLVRQCPSCTRVRVRVRWMPFFPSGYPRSAADSDSGRPPWPSPAMEKALPGCRTALTWPSVRRGFDISPGLSGLAEAMGGHLLELDLGNNCGLRMWSWEDEDGTVTDADDREISMGQGLFSVGTNCRNLVALDLSYCVMDSSDTTRRVEYDDRLMDLRGASGAQPGTILHIAANCRRLQSLNIAGLGEEMSPRLPQGHPLAGHGAPGSGRPTVLNAAIRCWPALKHLNMQGHQEPLTHSFVEALVSTCTQLQYLDTRLSYGASNWRWDADKLKAVVEGCTAITEVRWGPCHGSAMDVPEAERLAMEKSRPGLRLRQQVELESDDESYYFTEDDFDEWVRYNDHSDYWSDDSYDEPPYFWF